jgi:NADH-quinone oxidoreductase subunit A
VNPFIPILLVMLFAVGVAAAMLVVSSLLGKSKDLDPARLQPYECGMTPVGGARGRFPVKFYLVAMLFILFDVDTIFLYPWALSYKTFLNSGLGLFALGEVVVFLAILGGAYVYIWRRGALEWQ